MAKQRSHVRRTVIAMLLASALIVPVSCQDEDSVSPPQSSTHIRRPAVPPPPPTPTRSPTPISIEKPTPHSRVQRTITVSGEASTSSGLVGWELRYQGTAVDSGFARGSTGRYEVRITAPAPGQYQIALFEERSAAGNYTKLVTTNVTVR